MVSNGICENQSTYQILQEIDLEIDIQFGLFSQKPSARHSGHN